jgi:PKD repeat protein
VSNPDQVDLDRDGIGYDCDPDVDLLSQSVHSARISATGPESGGTPVTDATADMKDGLFTTEYVVNKSQGAYDILSFRAEVDSTELSTMMLSTYVSSLGGDTARVYAYNADADSANASIYVEYTLTTGWNDLDVTSLLPLMDGFGFVKFRLTITRNSTGIAEAYFTATPASGGANNPPVAVANGPYTGTAGSPVSFSSAGSYDPDGDAITYLWDFGDTNTSTEENPSHTYASSGTYTVILTVTDTYNDTGVDTTSADISGGGSPEICDDTIDNDLDTFVDCDDSDCIGDPACPADPEICDDTIDNDGDTFVDCDDSDCVGDPACPAGEPEICDDGIDNDLDGKTDCADKKDCRNDPAC